MTPDLSRLLSEYLDGANDAATQASLAEYAKAHPGEVPEILDFLRDAASLHLLLSPSRAALPDMVRQAIAFNKTGDTFAIAVMDAIASDQKHFPASRASRWNGRRIFVPLAAAAALVLAVFGVNVWQANQSGKAVVGYVADVRGKVARIRDSQSGIQDSGFRIQNGTQLRVGEIIAIGDAVQVGADGYVKFAYPDGSEIELSKNTQMALGASRESRLLGLVQVFRGKWLKLDVGQLTAQVAKQKVGQPMVLSTPHAQVTVVGTKFILTADSDQTRLDVQEGLVRMESLVDQKTADVGSGEYAIAGKDGLEEDRANVEKMADLSNPILPAIASSNSTPVATAFGTPRVLREIKVDGLAIMGGFCFDGKALWCIAPSNELVRIDALDGHRVCVLHPVWPQTNNIVVGGANNVVGWTPLVWDGKAFWTKGITSLSPSLGMKIHAFDCDTGALLKSLQMKDFHLADYGDWVLWGMSLSPNGGFYAVACDPVSGKVLRRCELAFLGDCSHEVGEMAGAISMAYNNGSIWILRHIKTGADRQMLYQVNPENGNLVRPINLSRLLVFQFMTRGDRGTLWLEGSASTDERRVNEFCLLDVGEPDAK